MVNCLANHGYIARDGRNIHFKEIYTAVREVGVGADLGAAFAYPIFYEHESSAEKSGSWLHRTWMRLNPIAFLGMRRPGQTDSMGRPVIDLDQLALPGVVEHDISLTRRDHQQVQGNSALQADLVEELLSSSKNGKTLTRADLATFRKHRVAMQTEENPELLYQGFAKLLSYGEISLILDVVGNGNSVPIEYARAFLLEERLPFEEGWRSRQWWKLGVVELQLSIFRVWRMMTNSSI